MNVVQLTSVGITRPDELVNKVAWAGGRIAVCDRVSLVQGKFGYSKLTSVGITGAEEIDEVEGGGGWV